MKKYFIALIFPFFFQEIHCQVVSYSQAKDKAISFFRQIEGQKNDLKSASMAAVDSFRTFTLRSASLLKSSALIDEPAFYIFNRTDHPGFVIVSAEKRIRDIIAWSDQTTMCDINPELETLLDQYAGEIALSKELNVSSPAISNSNLTAVPPLLGNIMWSQAPDPFNSLCPVDQATGKTCPAGCVATAMAQVIYYYKYPQVGTGSSSYSNKYGTISVNYANEVYNYDAMSDHPVSGEKNPEIAKLVYDCGVSVETDYSPYGSSSFVGQISSALANYFKYKQSTVRYRSSYTLENWQSLINNEIDNKRPVIYGALDPLDPLIPDDVTSGHAFILDGYNDQDQYHINWGWGGCSNGYYSLNLLKPSDCDSIYTYSDSHMMITGIQPSTSFECLLSVNSDSLHYAVSGGSQSISVSSNSTWTVSDNAYWISVSTVSGSKNETLTVETNVNQGFSERTGVITITGCDEVLIIPVVQDGTCSLSLSSDKISFSTLEGSTKIGINSTASWLVSTDASWITVLPVTGNGKDSLIISVTNNTGYSQRSGIVTISGCNTSKILSVSQDGTCSLSLSSGKLEFASGAGNQTITIISSTSWSVKSNVSWAFLSAESGYGNGTFMVSVKDNAANIQRSGTITVTGCNVNKTITIIQQGVCYINLAAHNVEFNPDAGDKFVFITSNSSWKASSENSWISASPGNGNENDYLGIMVEANSGQSPRAGIVTVTGCDSVQTILVIQQSYCPLNVSTELLDFTYGTGTKSATVISTSGWTVSTDTPWLSISPRTGSKTGIITVAVPENSTDAKRSGVVTVTGCYLTKNITVVQDICSFSVSDQKLTFTPEGGTKSLNINSSSSWSASADSQWVTVTPMFGVQSGNTLISADANTSGNRSAVVTVSGCFSSKEIEILQGGTMTPASAVNSGQFRLYPSPTDRYVKIEFPSGSGECTLDIYSVSGQKIRSQQHLQSGDIIDMAGLAKGLYYFEIYNRNFLKSEKIVLK